MDNLIAACAVGLLNTLVSLSNQVPTFELPKNYPLFEHPKQMIQKFSNTRIVVLDQDEKKLQKKFPNQYYMHNF